MPTAPTTAWVRSATLGLAAVVLVAVYWRGASAPVLESDAWGAGATYWSRLQEGQFPSSTGQGWLGQVVVYLAAATAGPAGVAVLAGFLAAFKTFLYYLTFRRVSGSVLLALAGVALLEGSRWTTVASLRPQALAELCWAGLFFVCVRDTPSRSALVAVPILVALWANLHGSFPLAFLLLAVLVVGRVIDKARWCGGLVAATEERGVRRLAAALGLSLGAACLNPAGPKLVAEAARASRQGVGQALMEWQAINLPQVGGLPFLASLLVVLVTLRLSPRRFRATEAALLVVFGVGAWFSPGFVFWWATVWPLAMLLHGKAILEACRASQDAATTPKLALQ